MLSSLLQPVLIVHMCRLLSSMPKGTATKNNKGGSRIVSSTFNVSSQIMWCVNNKTETDCQGRCFSTKELEKLKITIFQGSKWWDWISRSFLWPLGFILCCSLRWRHLKMHRHKECPLLFFSYNLCKLYPIFVCILQNGIKKGREWTKKREKKLNEWNISYIFL